MVDPASGDKLRPIVPVCPPHFPADPRGRGAAGVGAQGGGAARRPASAGVGGVGVALC